MKAISIIGLDLAKNVFQVCGVDKHGKRILSRKLSRAQVTKFFALLPSCVVGMEACATSQYWARVIEELGHEVRRIPAQFVAPFRQGNKTDVADALAICEAAQRPHMRFVPNKTQAQADMQAVHRVRSGFMRARTATANQIRSLLAENGIIIQRGVCHVRKNLPGILDDIDNELSGLMRRMLYQLQEYLETLEANIAEQDAVIATLSKETEVCRRLLKVPGIGPMTATILTSLCGHVSNFNGGRAFSSYLGLTPKEHSFGGKQRLGRITKRGNVYARTLLIHGARSVIYAMQSGKKPYGGNSADDWLFRLVERRGIQKACVALANKNARIAWKLLTTENSFEPARASAA